MKKIFNITLLSVFISGLSLDHLNSYYIGQAVKGAYNWATGRGNSAGQDPEKNAESIDEYGSRVYKSGIKAGKETGIKAGKRIGGKAGFKHGFDKGRQAGYDEGRQFGYDEGHQSGYGEGRQAGYDEGRQAGLKAGKNIGWASGYDDGYGTGLKSGKRIGGRAGFKHGFDKGSQAGREFGRNEVINISINEVISGIQDDDVKNIAQWIRSDNGDPKFKASINALFEKEGPKEEYYSNTVKKFINYSDYQDYSNFSTDGVVTVYAHVGETSSQLPELSCKNEVFNALLSLKWTVAIYKSMRDYNGIELNKYDTIKIYKSIMVIVSKYTRNKLDISPKIERINSAEALFKKTWDGKGKVKSLPIVLKIKLNKGKSDGVWGYLRLQGVGNFLTEQGRARRAIKADLFMPNNTNIKGLFGKRFYVDKSKALDDSANKAWENIPELEGLLEKTTNFNPRKNGDLKISNIRLRDILKICVNGDIRSNEAFKKEYVKIYIPEYIDFIGLDNFSKGAYLLNQQKGRYVSELFKEYNKDDDSYTVVISVIKNGKVLANTKTFGIKAKNAFSAPFIDVQNNINRTKKGKSRMVDDNNKWYNYDVIKDVHSVIYLLKVKKSVYDTFMTDAKKYDAI